MSQVRSSESAASIRATQAARFVELGAYVFIAMGLFGGVFTAFAYADECREYDCSFTEKYPSFWVGIGIAVGAAFQGAVVIMISAYIQARLSEPTNHQPESPPSTLPNPRSAPTPPPATPSSPSDSEKGAKSWSYGHNNRGSYMRMRVSRGEVLTLQTWDGKRYGNQWVQNLKTLRAVSQDSSTGALTIDMESTSIEFVPDDAKTLYQTCTPLLLLAGTAGQPD